MISKVLFLMISWEHESKVLIGAEIFFNGLGNWRMKLSTEVESMLDLEEWDARKVNYFVEK